METRGDPKSPEYTFSGKLYTDAEQKLRVLLHDEINNRLKCVGKRVVINGKTRLADIVQANMDRPDGRRLISNIWAKHIDFTITELDESNIICLVELDDFYHERENIKARDRLVNSITEQVGVKLFHVKEPIKTVNKITIEPILIYVLDYFSPRCPECGAKMTVRQSKKACNAGHLFYGCENYHTPLKCMHTLDID